MPEGGDVAHLLALGFDFAELALCDAVSSPGAATFVRIDRLGAGAFETPGGEAPIVVRRFDHLNDVRRLAAAGRHVLLANVDQSQRDWSDQLRFLPPELGLCLDLGVAHALAEAPPAVDEPALAYLHATDRIELLRLHDSQTPDEGAERNLPLGRGSLRLTTVLAALRDAGVTAPIVLDISAPDDELVQSLALARSLVSAFW